MDPLKIIDWKEDETNSQSKRITPENILTINLTDYCLNINKKPEDFRVFGIQINGIIKLEEVLNTPIVRLFIERVPANTEAVVNYSGTCSLSKIQGIDYYSYTAQGTALIPR